MCLRAAAPAPDSADSFWKKANVGDPLSDLLPAVRPAEPGSGKAHDCINLRSSKLALLFLCSPRSNLHFQVALCLFSSYILTLRSNYLFIIYITYSSLIFLSSKNKRGSSLTHFSCRKHYYLFATRFRCVLQKNKLMPAGWSYYFPWMIHRAQSWTGALEHAKHYRYLLFQGPEQTVVRRQQFLAATLGCNITFKKFK